MSPIELLQIAMAEMHNRLVLVNGRWDTPTPCEGWTAHDLATHVVNGAKMSTTLLKGGTTEQATAHFTGTLGSDPAEEYGKVSATELAAFEASSLDAIVKHPRMDMPGSLLLNFRMTDYLLHAWDLARALGSDETLNADAVRGVWDGLQPMAAMLPHTGAFGTSSSGDVADDAPLQLRLLDLSGRRP